MSKTFRAGTIDQPLLLPAVVGGFVAKDRKRMKRAGETRRIFAKLSSVVATASGSRATAAATSSSVRASNTAQSMPPSAVGGFGRSSCDRGGPWLP